jgi:CrcB protein
MMSLLVFLGAGAGGVVRYYIEVLSARWFGTAFPYGTLFINVAGGLAMGLLTGWFAFRAGAGGSLLSHERWQALIGVGMLGGFTTFSTFSLEVAMLWKRGEMALAAGYAALSVVLAVGALAAGLWLARSAA